MTSHKSRRWVYGVVGTALVLLGFTQHARAQRISSLNATVDALGGIDDSSQFAATPRAGATKYSSYSMYPSVSLVSQTPYSTFNVDYSYGRNNISTDPPLGSNSHVASATINGALSPRWRMRIANSFSYSSDARTVYALRGVLPTEDPSILALFFDPVALNQSVLNVGSGVSLDHQMSAKSSMSFAAEYTRRDYQTGSVQSLSDQESVSGNVGYSRRISEHASWGIDYNLSYYTFSNFMSSVTNVVRFNFSNQLAKDTTATFSVGGSSAQNVGGAGFGSSASYETAAGLDKTIKGNTVKLSFSQDYAHPNGLASVSRNRRAQVGVSRNLGRQVNIFISGSVFESKGVLDNVAGSRGGTGTANVGFRITEKISLQVGAQLQRYTEPAPFAFTHKRAFVSLRYTHPNLWQKR